jgi:hypothetical protein
MGSATEGVDNEAGRINLERESSGAKDVTNRRNMDVRLKT